MVKVLIARATAIYEKKCTAATPDGTGGLTKIYDSLSASETALLCPPKRLAASSRRHTLSYFRSFCMKVDALGIAICQENAGQIAKLIRDMTESRKKARAPPRPKTPSSGTPRRWSGSWTDWRRYGLTRRSNR